MSDIDIRSGGAICVDPAALRDAAGRWRGVAVELDDLAALAWRASALLVSTANTAAEIDTLRARWLGLRGEDAAATARLLADRLDGLAAAYELIEIGAEAAALRAAGHQAAADVLEARAALLRAEFPDAAVIADDALGQWRWGVPAEMTRQSAVGTAWMSAFWAPAAMIPLATGALWRAVGASGLGRVAAPAAEAGSGSAGPPRREGVRHGSTSAPAPPRGPTVVRPLAPPAAVAAVSSLAQTATRIPRDGEARVRIERYRMPSGASEYAVYIAGTRTLVGGPDDPWDMQSNLELYRGERSASLTSVELALAAAGAQPGDVVHAIGHSQGGMLAAQLALSDQYDTRTLVTFGSPVEAAVGSDVLSVGVRHTDDAVAALAGAGHPGQVGAPGSFVVERVADPRAGLQDVALAAHGIEQYVETGALVDASSDPRARALDQLWEHLGEAESVDVTEYAAVRSASPSSDAE
ncbi:hypothetical protein GCM10009808_20610 [Microbacterium sediminicola]|uniref:Alpha/beta hydrolase n=1 Tax=Microbacterium sediminicola TaxID=415210 RepID=A0ABP4UFA8_9MICO